jgi:hypothetical protein
MGVLAFGDSSTWAIKDYEDPTHVKKLAKASHKPFEEREKEKKAGLVSLKKVLQAPSSKDKSRSRGVRGDLNPLSPPSSDINSNPNFAPRSAWPEGKFTIKYPKGYDPELREIRQRSHRIRGRGYETPGGGAPAAGGRGQGEGRGGGEGA